MCIAAYIVDQRNYVVFSNLTAGGELTGWEFNKGKWNYRRNESEFYDAVESGGTCTVKGAETGTAVILLVWNAIPLTEQQHRANEIVGDYIFNSDWLGAGGNKQGQRLAFWAMESGLLRPGYNEAQIGVANFYQLAFQGANGALFEYLRMKLATTNKTLPGIMSEAATAAGVRDWNGLGEELGNL